MAISVFELFSIGIGPSSSHTVGPMRAALKFVQEHEANGLLTQIQSIQVALYGSLGATGKGHGTDKAVIGGLSGLAPESAEPQRLKEIQETAEQANTISVNAKHRIKFSPTTDLKFSGKVIGPHSNALRLTSFDQAQKKLVESTYFSVGGGFVVTENEFTESKTTDEIAVPFPFTTAEQLLNLCHDQKMSISTLMLNNEQAWRCEDEVRKGLLDIWSVMKACVERGCREEGILPGGLNVKRRAAPLFKKLQNESTREMPLSSSMDWVDLWALAVNEENAAGGRVVTAPTNGAAGIIPAVLHYYHRFCPGATEEGTVGFLLTAAAIGTLFKINASISGAEVGCQGEVGSACSMAAAGLAEVMGGTPSQVENAAEIGMEHNLGLTCDPSGGLVQVPCIERNAMAAVKAINAARLALRGDGHHFVSLDKVIETMRQTGKDMKTKYKETARGGLAVNVTEC